MPSKAVLEPGSSYTRDIQDGLAVTIERLSALLGHEEEDDYLPPGEYAFATACALLNGAGTRLVEFPPGSPSADGAGGIRIEWERSGKEVRLVVPAKPGGKTYIYHEVGEEYAPEQTVSAETLARWLGWLASA